MIKTTRSKDGVLYEAPGWHKFIPFGQDRKHRSGGPAFREAAKEQERRIREVKP